MTLQSLRKQRMKTDMGEQKSNPSILNLKKTPGIIILQPNEGWGLERLCCHVFNVKSYMWHFKNSIIHLQIYLGG